LRAEFEPLIQLQEIDLQIQKIEDEKAQCPRHLEALREILQVKEEELHDLRDRLSDVRRRRTEVDDELQMETSRLGKSQQKLTAVKTNREYQALLKEIDEIKKANKTREDEIVTAMEEVETLEAEIKLKEEEVERTRTEVGAEQKRLQQIEAELNGEIASLNRDREAVAGRVRKDLLARYHFLRDKRGGIAITAVVNAVCSGCHMNIPPQLFNELLRNEKIHYCPTCQRLIYAGEEN